MKPTDSKIYLLVAVAACLFAMGTSTFARKGQESSIPEATKAVVTDAALRDLWVEHVFWVRAVVVNALARNDAAATVAEKEVVTNAKAIAAAIEPFYGPEASEKLLGLLAGHYDAIKAYLKAHTIGSKSKRDAAFQSLVENADDIATFLSGANPHLPFDTLKGLLVAHGTHHVQQIQQLAARDYAGEARTWRTMRAHMLVIADALAGALVAQFPDQF